MEILFIIGIAQAIFFSLLLISKKNNINANRLLSIWLFLISFSLFIHYLYLTDLIQKVPYLAGLDNPIPFLYPPFIYYYTKLLTSRKPLFSIKSLIHLLPFILYFLYLFFNFYLKSGVYKYEFIKNLQYKNYPIDLLVANYLKILQAVVYLVIMTKMIHKHQICIKQEFSNTEKINLTWLKIITYSLILIYFFKFIGIISSSFVSISDINLIITVSDLSIILFIYIIAFYGIKQPKIFINSQPTDENKSLQDEVLSDLAKVNTINKKQKYSGSPLSDDESKKLLNLLQKYMETEKPYLQSQLTINDIAGKLEINPKYLSQVINEQIGLNFFNYVNLFRVEEVKKRLLDKKYQHLSIFGIALDCGFNSKSSFNSIFKKFTNQTPTLYISASS
jgi:AraC-like DNA-binding protein